MKINRGHLLALLLPGFLTFSHPCPAAGKEPLFPGMPEVVSDTYRGELERDVPGTLDRIRTLGFTDLEFSHLFDETAAELRSLRDARGMAGSFFGVSWDDLILTMGGMVANTKMPGAGFVRAAWLPNRQPFTVALAEKTAADFNDVGKLLQEKHGLTFCYDNHGCEFVRHGDGTLFDSLLDRTSPQDVIFELDILWAHFPGADPAALLEKYGNRFKLLHRKDLRKGIAADLSGKTAVEKDGAPGTGQLDLPRILRAARKAGVQHYYFEDESPSTVVQGPQTL